MAEAILPLSRIRRLPPPSREALLKQQDEGDDEGQEEAADLSTLRGGLSSLEGRSARDERARRG